MAIQNEFYLRLPGDLTIGVTSNRELHLSEKEELLLGAYLPDVEVCGSFSGRADAVLCHIESGDQSLRAGQNEIEVRDTWHETFPDDLPHLLYSIARTFWLARGYYPTHAACIGGTEFTLLPGHSGVGKTTTALTAVEQFDQKLLSGNTTLIRFDDSHAMLAVAGTRTMTLTTKDFERSGYATTRSIEYGNRTAFTLAREKQAPGPQAIGKVALVRLGREIEQWSPLSTLSAIHTLYPFFLDTERTDCIVAAGNAIFLGETPSLSRSELVRNLSHSLGNIPVNAGIGNKEFLAQKVSES